MRKEQEAGGLNGRAARWGESLSELKARYPGLSFDGGLSDPRLKALLRAGVDFGTALECVSLADIREYLEQEAGRRAAERLALNAGRARENGIAAARTAAYESGAKSLSKRDREEIVRRVLAGEEIRL